MTAITRLSRESAITRTGRSGRTARSTARSALATLVGCVAVVPVALGPQTAEAASAPPVSAAAGAVRVATPVSSASPRRASAVSRRSATRRTIPGLLDLGRAGLPETRKVTTITTGVTLTTIVRGQTSAGAGRGTTDRGPWRINVATIDPRTARGQLRTAIGSDIARTETVSTLARWSRAYVAVNGSYFSEGRRMAPGDMVGLAVNGGTIVSQPQRVAGHVGVLMDSRTKKLRMDTYTWQGTLTGRGETLPLDAVNAPTAPPKGCEQLTDAAQCPDLGQLVRFTPLYAVTTPSGPGAEVVFDRAGCVVAARPVRGARLAASQTSIQATGHRAADLLRVAGGGCPTYRESLYGSDGRQVALTPTTYGVTGRYRLLRDGEVVAPTYPGSYFARNPRTFIGRTAGGSVMLVTVEGRSATSIGVTLVEEARLARSLGLVDAVNLDGGGSTAMVVRGKLVTRPSGGRERPVGDAVVFMP